MPIATVGAIPIRISITIPISNFQYFCWILSYYWWNCFSLYHWMFLIAISMAFTLIHYTDILLWLDLFLFKLWYYCHLCSCFSNFFSFLLLSVTMSKYLTNPKRFVWMGTHDLYLSSLRWARSWSERTRNPVKLRDKRNQKVFSSHYIEQCVVRNFAVRSISKIQRHFSLMQWKMEYSKGYIRPANVA